MARQGRSGGGSRPSRAGTRPTVPAARPAPTQTRSASTTAMPAGAQKAGPPGAPAAGVPAVQQSGGAAGGGMMSNIISTGMGVALGHQISNGISSMFGGGAAEPPAAAAPPAQEAAQSNSWGGANCEADVKQFTKCMDDHKGNMDICGWYLSQLKACQSAAKEY